MAIVIHTINKNKNRYAYHHYREGGKVKSDYIGPVDSKGTIRDCKDKESCVDRVKVGTTTTQLKEIYQKAVKKDEARKAVKEPVDGKKIERIKHGKRTVTAKRSEPVKKIVKEKKVVAKTKTIKDEDKKTYTVKDVEKIADKYDVDLGKAVNPKEKFSKKQIDGLEEEIKEKGNSDFYTAFKKGHLETPEHYDNRENVRKNREKILKNPKLAIESVIWKAQHYTKNDKVRDTPLDRDKAKKIAEKDIKKIKDFVAAKKPLTKKDKELHKEQDKMIKKISASTDIKELGDVNSEWKRSVVDVNGELKWKKGSEMREISIRNKEEFIEWRINHHKYLKESGQRSISRDKPLSDKAARIKAKEDIDLINNPDKIVEV